MPVRSNDVCSMCLVEIMPLATTCFNLSTYACTMSKFQDYVLKLIVPKLESPLCLQVKAWCPEGSRELFGHKEPEEMSRPGHHLMAIWCLLGV